MNLSVKIVFALSVCLFFAACKKNHTPKPRGYFRISFPEKAYVALNEEHPYNFEIPLYGIPVAETGSFAEPHWINIKVPENKAEIHISYKNVDGNLGEYTEESRDLTFKHTIKASSIEEQLYLNPAKKVYGIIYRIKGNAASPMQFYLTDSTRHFLRGALYIREVPNYDSLRPVIRFLEEDIIQLIESTEWK